VEEAGGAGVDRGKAGKAPYAAVPDGRALHTFTEVKSARKCRLMDCACDFYFRAEPGTLSKNIVSLVCSVECDILGHRR
jgi:hypothetical protein